MHKMKRQYRACYEDNDEDDDKSCGVKYRVDSCETKNFGTIYQNDKIHTHKVDESYNYEIGINEKVKTAINKILEFNPQQKPNIVRKMLNTEKENYQNIWLYERCFE